MAGFNGPNLVTDGLVLALDAASVQSYPGSGDTWFNLVGAQDTTLYNSPTHSTDGGGCFDFDGTDQYALTNTTLKDIGNYLTCSFWYRVEEIINGRVWNAAAWTDSSNFFEYMSHDPYVSGSDYLISNWAYSKSGGTRVDYSWDTGSGYPGNTGLNTWKNVTTSFNSQYGVGYLNSVAIGSPDLYGFQDWANATNSAGFYLGTGRNYHYNSANSWIYSDCQIAMVHIWNRVLTAAEVLQNYDAHKGRFGL